MPTLIYNYNSFVRWDKDECDIYTISNIIDYSAVDVTITDMTPSSDPPWQQTFTLQPSENNSVTLPGDGVFKICAVAQELLPDRRCQMTTINYPISVINIGKLQSNPDADEAQLWLVELTNGGTIYQNVNYGGSDPNANFGTPPTSYQNAITIIQNYLNANGGGTVEILQPGQASANFPFLPVDNDDYQLVIAAFNGDTVSQVVTAQDATVRPVWHYPNVNCFTTWQAGGCGDRQWVVSVLFNGQELITRPYNMTVQADVDALLAIIAAWLAVNGGGQVVINEQVGFYVIFENCLQSAVITLADLVPSVEECDYVFELCDTFACMTRALNNWLCQDPCASPCDVGYMPWEQARRTAIELSTLFHAGLMPLISQDRLWHLGNWDISNDRLTNINNIIGLFKQYRDYMKQCGFNCCDPAKDCGCKDCSPCGTEAYNGMATSPCTTCK